MVQYYKTIDHTLQELTKPEEHAWIHLTRPTEAELRPIEAAYGLPADFLRAALDEEERSRIEKEDHSTLIVVDVPLCKTHESTYTTLPLGIVITDEVIITVCLKELPLINDFIKGRVKTFSTSKRTRFILQLLYKNATYYLKYLRQIEKLSDNLEQGLHKSMKNQQLLQLLDLQKSLVYFSTSLRGNSIILEKMMKLESIQKFPEDEDLLEDVIIENKQAIEMAGIYSNILAGMADAFGSIISNNLNIVMKFLTSVTIILTIPTMIASFFGMNVPLPFGSSPYGFLIILCISFGISTILGIIMAKKKMF